MWIMELLISLILGLLVGFLLSALLWWIYALFFNIEPVKSRITAAILFIFLSFQFTLLFSAFNIKSHVNDMRDITLNGTGKVTALMKNIKHIPFIDLELDFTNYIHDDQMSEKYDELISYFQTMLSDYVARRIYYIIGGMLFFLITCRVFFKSTLSFSHVDRIHRTGIAARGMRHYRTTHFHRDVRR